MQNRFDLGGHVSTGSALEAAERDTIWLPQRNSKTTALNHSEGILLFCLGQCQA